MGRNKDIKLLHEVTGLSYKECRARMKKYKWNFFDAYMDGQCFNSFLNSMYEALEQLKHSFEGVAEALRNIHL